MSEYRADVDRAGSERHPDLARRGRHRTRRGRLYAISGPALEQPPASPHFLLAPAEDDAFAARLYRGQVTLGDLRAFLARCRIAQGAVVDEMQYLRWRTRRRCCRFWTTGATRPTCRCCPIWTTSTRSCPPRHST